MSKNIVPYQPVQPSQRKATDIGSQISHKEENDGEEGWICGRGVAMKKNQLQCVCPPSFYGEYCQYFSD